MHAFWYTEDGVIHDFLQVSFSEQRKFWERQKLISILIEYSEESFNFRYWEPNMEVFQAILKLMEIYFPSLMF